jgi:hypothetical protein
MIEKVLIFINLSIIFYEIYLIYLENNIKKKNKKIKKQIKYEDNNIFNYNNYNNYNNEENKINDENEENEDNDENNILIDINMYGKPSEYIKNKSIVWSILDPHPWSKIIYKYNEKYPFYFYIKIKIPSLNDYNNWKNIISNLDFDPISGEMIIPTEDEETALSISNLIISNFKGDLSLEEILNKNLINVSINKARKYDIVKNKIIEQIMTNLKGSTSDIIESEIENTDLAKKNDNYEAYDSFNSFSNYSNF